MVRKFECEECKNTFDADDNELVKCPRCHSDNVDYYKYHLPRWLPWLVVCGVIATILFLIWHFNPSPVPPPKPKQDVAIDRDSAEQKKVQQSDNTYINEGGTIAPSLSIADKDYNADDATYKCRVAVSYPPQQPYKVVVRTKDGQLVAESEDGKIDKLPYSKDDGTYVFSLVDKSTGSLLCEEREFPDFPKLDVVQNPWNESDLQRVLNSDELLVDNPNIAIPHKVIVVNKPKGDTSPTNSLRDVQQLLKDCHLTAKVEKVEHDNMKKISVAKIRIDYPDDWLSETDDF